MMKAQAAAASDLSVVTSSQITEMSDRETGGENKRCTKFTSLFSRGLKLTFALL